MNIFKHLCFTSLALGMVFSVNNTSAMTIGGVEFPEGAVSFADAVVSTTPTSPPASNGNFDDPLDTLGIPNYVSNLGTGAYSLGSGGSITLQFTNNSLTGSNSTADDLWVFEIGPQTEPTMVEISQNGIDFINVGSTSGATSGIDIDPYLLLESIDWFTQFSFIRLTDINGNGGSTPGADIDAVGAISSSAPVSAVPVPAALPLFGTGLALMGFLGWRRKSKANA